MVDNKRVLIIDDSDVIRAYLRNILAPRSALVEGAATAMEGLDMCAAAQYDLILLDLVLPDLDGIQVLERIRQKDTTSAIVMVTAHGGIEPAIAALQRGADGYVQKQDISASRDHAEFLYALEQALTRRAGLVAKEQLEKVRADFYSMVTHDLRNPTGIILTALGMLMDSEADPLTARQQQLLALANTAANKLIRLINDYLDFAKIDAGYLRLELGEVDLVKVADSSAQLAQIQAQAKHQTLTLDLPAAPLLAHADAERLKQVLDNLLSNAIKYTGAGGRISLRLREQDGQAVFCVSDTGMGIPPEQLGALFTKYHRVPGEATRGIRGTGLGLLIVKEIVQAHGGAVQVESEGIPGKGSTFTVTIPLQSSTQPPVEPAAEPQAVPAPHSRAHELVFAQDAELRQLFFAEARKHVQTLQGACRQLYRSPQDEAALQTAQRASHTLKSGAGAMQQTAIQQAAVQLDAMLRAAVSGELTLTPTDVQRMAQLLDGITRALDRAEQT